MFNAALVILYAGPGMEWDCWDRDMEPRDVDLFLSLILYIKCRNVERGGIHVGDCFLLPLAQKWEKGICYLMHAGNVYIEGVV